MFVIDYLSLIYGITAGVIITTIVLIGAILVDEYRRERKKQ